VHFCCHTYLSSSIFAQQFGAEKDRETEFMSAQLRNLFREYDFERRPPAGECASI
jgi:hypothetical protein